MPRLWVHGGDDAVPGDLPGDPPPSIGPVRSLSGLDILPGDQRQQPHRGGGLLPQFPVLQRRHERRSEEHTSELQSRPHLVCRLLLEKKKKKKKSTYNTKKKNKKKIN